MHKDVSNLDIVWTAETKANACWLEWILSWVLRWGGEETGWCEGSKRMWGQVAAWVKAQEWRGQRTWLGRGRCWEDKEGTFEKGHFMPPQFQASGTILEISSLPSSPLSLTLRLLICMHYEALSRVLRGSKPLDSFDINQKSVVR